MNVGRPVLSKGVHRSSTAPVSRTREEFVIVSPPSTPQKDAPKGLFRPRGVVGSLGMGQIQDVPALDAVRSESSSAGVSVVQSGVRKGHEVGRDEKSDDRKEDSSRRVRFSAGCSTDDNGGGAVVPHKSKGGPTSTPDIRKLLASKDPADVAVVELLQAYGCLNKIMALSSGDSGALKEKHFYCYDSWGDLAGTSNNGPLTNSMTSPNTTPFLNSVVAGTGYNQRLGPRIRMLRMHIRSLVHISHKRNIATGEDWGPSTSPVFRMWIVKEKVLINSASPVAALASDSLPPGTNPNPLSNLGRSMGPTDQPSWLTAVPNPLDLGIAEVIDRRTLPNYEKLHDATSRQFSVNQNGTTTLSETQPMTFIVEWDVNLHGEECVFLGSNLFPSTNALTLQVCIHDPGFTGAAGAQRVSVFTQHSVDLVFQDVTSE